MNGQLFAVSIKDFFIRRLPWLIGNAAQKNVRAFRQKFQYMEGPYPVPSIGRVWHPMRQHQNFGPGHGLERLSFM
jgi:hypothetical protein